MPTALAIALSGALGALARWGAIRVALALGAHASVATLAVNVAGAFLAGLLFGLLRGAHPLLCAAVFLGFLGAFTTFSAYALDTLRLLLAGDLPRAFLDLLLHNLLGLCAAAFGLWLGSLAPRAL